MTRPPVVLDVDEDQVYVLRAPDDVAAIDLALAHLQAGPNPAAIPMPTYTGWVRRVPWCWCGGGHDWHIEHTRDHARGATPAHGFYLAWP